QVNRFVREQLVGLRISHRLAASEYAVVLVLVVDAACIKLAAVAERDAIVEASSDVAAVFKPVFIDCQRIGQERDNRVGRDGRDGAAERFHAQSRRQFFGAPAATGSGGRQ